MWRGPCARRAVAMPFTHRRLCVARGAGYNAGAMMKRTGRGKTLRPICALCVLVVLTGASGCRFITGASKDRPAAGGKGGSASPGAEPGTYGDAVRLAVLQEKGVTESSGLVASRTTPGVFWTHNDSGDARVLYAFDRQGRRRGVWRVTGAEARDWEDIAAGPGPRADRPYLYVGDIGDNSGLRKSITVYRVAEPAVTDADAASTKAQPRRTAEAEAIRLRYPDGPHDAETLMVHPQTGDIYIVTKHTLFAAGVYKLPASRATGGAAQTLERVGDLRAPAILGGMFTGGDISPDGRRVALCDYGGAYEMTLPEGGTAFDEIWGQFVVSVGTGARLQGEAVCYRLDGRALLLTSEKRPVPLIEVTRGR